MAALRRRLNPLLGIAARKNLRGQGPDLCCQPARRLVSGRAKALPGAQESGNGGQQRSDQARRRQFQPRAGRGDRRLSRHSADQGRGPALRRHGDLRRNPGKRARRRRFRHPVDVVSGQRPSDGIADHHRRAAARLGAAHHGGDPLFRLCPAGSQSRTAHADLGQARRQSHHPCRRRPRADARSSCRADPGLLRYPDRQSVRRAGDDARHPGSASISAR